MKKVGQGRKNLNDNDGSLRDKQEEYAMRQFVKLVTEGDSWRRMLTLINALSPFVKILSGLIPGLKNWVTYRTFPTLNGNLHKKVSNMKGVIYE